MRGLVSFVFPHAFCNITHISAGALRRRVKEGDCVSVYKFAPFSAPAEIDGNIGCRVQCLLQVITGKFSQVFRQGGSVAPFPFDSFQNIEKFRISGRLLHRIVRGFDHVNRIFPYRSVFLVIAVSAVVKTGSAEAAQGLVNFESFGICYDFCPCFRIFFCKTLHVCGIQCRVSGISHAIGENKYGIICCDKAFEGVIDTAEKLFRDIVSFGNQLPQAVGNTVVHFHCDLFTVAVKRYLIPDNAEGLHACTIEGFGINVITCVFLQRKVFLLRWQRIIDIVQ